MKAIIRTSRALVIVVCTSIGLISCQDSSTSTAEQQKKGITKNDVAKYIAGDSSSILGVEDIYGYMILSSIRSSSIDFNSTKLYENTNAEFRDLSHTTDATIPVGMLTLNSITVPLFTGATASSYGVIDYPVQTSQSYTWSVAGNTSFPSFSLSVTSPSSKMNISSPALNDIISKSSSLSVSWSGNYEAENIILITVRGQNRSYRYYAEDDGSFTIPGTDLQNCGNGVAMIKLERVRYNIHELTSGKYALATIITSHDLEVNFIN